VRQGGVWGDGVPRSVPNVASVGPVSRAIASSLTQGIRRYRAARSSDAIAACRMLAFIHVFSICVYVFSVCVVATILFVAVDDLEPNRRYASVLKFLTVFVSVAAIAGRLMRSSADGLSALMP
jgi:hypothetical protein